MRKRQVAMGNIYVKYRIKKQVGIPEKIITQEPGG
jgi:hypothetical protein